MTPITFTQRALLVLAMAFLLLSPHAADSKTKGGKQKDDKGEKETQEPTVQRVPTQAQENIQNTVSRISFYQSNYGIFGLNVKNGNAGGIWPRGSSNAYIFGGGIWFGAQKAARDASGNIIKTGEGLDSLNKLCIISYNPNSGHSWMVPGTVNTPVGDQPIDNSAKAINNYRVYLSTDYNSETGEPIDPKDVRQDGPNWPIWDTKPFPDSLKVDRYFGQYVIDPLQRNIATFPKGPAIISGEDVFSVYRDNDLTAYEISPKLAKQEGYPIGIQVEQTDYTWGVGDYANFMFIKYLIINKSTDTLVNCWMAPSMDMDIGVANNDHNKIAIDDKFQDSLNLAVQWSDAESKIFGYIGLDFLESPALDSNNFIRTDKKVYTGNEQIGLQTFKKWTIDLDPKTPEERYDYMSGRTREGDNGPGDTRWLMATGAFNMRPGDTARIVVGIMFAYSATGASPTGQWADMKKLLDVDAFAQRVYDNNFLAPRPPDAATLSWAPLDNGVKLTWDTLSEASVDPQARGLDFLTYRLQRRRAPAASVASSFDPRIDTNRGWNLGWKTIATWVAPPLPDSLTRIQAALNHDLNLLGPWARLPQLIDVIPTDTAIIYTYPRFRFDTLHRPATADLPARADTIIRTFLDSAKGVGLKNGRTKAPWPAYTGFVFDPYNDRDTVVRSLVRTALYAIMDSITNHRAYVDVGDDNHDGQITENSSDLTQNEKLVNNVYYYYQLLAGDQGSTSENILPQENAGAGRNVVRAVPERPAAGFPANATVVSEEGLGGIRNFQFITYDRERLGQLFGGDTLEFQFIPTQNPQTQVTGTTTSNLVNTNLTYMTEVVVKSRRTGSELMRYLVDYGNKFADRADSLGILNTNNGIIFLSNPLDSNFVTYFATDSATGTAPYLNRRGLSVPYNGSFLTSINTPVWNTVGIYKATFGSSFDYSFVQFGDSLRFGTLADSTTPQSLVNPFTNNTGSDVNLVAKKQFIGKLAQQSVADYLPIPSIGQVKLQVEFSDGGTEVLTYKNKAGKTVTVNAPYLNTTVRNIAQFSRETFDQNGVKTIDTVKYNYTFPLDPLAKTKADTTQETAKPLPRVITPGDYALYAYVWQDRPTDATGRQSPLNRAKMVGGRVGTPGRYYLSVPPVDGVEDDGVTHHQVTFSHRLIVNGAEILLDGAGMGSTDATLTNPTNLPANVPTVDFKAGDKFVVDFTGGTLGLPQPGGKVLVAITNPNPAFKDSATGRDYTDDLLDQITVVPNPYLIDHVGQISTGDRKIYFTRLPEKCTIQIYTVDGQLLQTLEHVAGEQGGRLAVDAWDLLTKSNRETQSQLLIARITTPNGAETIKKFAIVVGGFRTFNQ